MTELDGPEHEKMRAAAARFKSALKGVSDAADRLAAAPIENGASAVAEFAEAEKELAAAKAAFDVASDPFRLALDAWPDPTGS